MAADLPAIKLVPSKGHNLVGDCAVCALGTLSGKSYEDVVEVAVRLGLNWRKGMYLSEIVRVGKKLGLTLRRVLKYDLETDIGILDMVAWDASTRRYQEHVVVLYAGKIFDSDLTVWSPDAFKSQYRAKFKSLLRLD